MRENPFQPPNTVEPVRPCSPARQRARMAFRAAVLLMIVPALYNYFEFDLKVLTANGIPTPVLWVMRSTNLVFLLGGCLAVWFAGLPLVERLSLALHSIFASNTEVTVWQDQLYAAIYRAAVLAIPGSVLWLVWVFGFYRTPVNFYVLSFLIGVPAHLLGAAVYVPLALNWYRLARGK